MAQAAVPGRPAPSWRRAALAALAFAHAAAAAQSHDMAGMDHGAMRMQGGAAPADARDPHAYSGGHLRADAHGQGQGQGHGAMPMADQRLFGGLLLDRLERAGRGSAGEAAYDARAWLGDAYDKLVVKAEGDAARGRIGQARTELLWSHAVDAFWDAQAGLRTDAGHGRPARHWLALGIQGLAPYWFEVDATAYLGEGGRAALRLSGEYELLLTRRLVLQPRIDARFDARDDAPSHVGRGLSAAAAGLRLRYEFSRQFAPYIGVERAGSFGRSAGFATAAGERPVRTRWVAGLRLWF